MKTFLLFFILYSDSVYSQNHTIDSVRVVLQTEKDDTNKINTLNKLCYFLNYYSEYDSAMHYAKEVISLSDKTNFKKGKIIAYQTKVWIYHTRGNYPEALKNYFILLKLSDETGEKKVIAKSYELGASVYASMGNYSEALKNYYTELKLYEELNDEQNIAWALQGIGTIYYYQDNHQEALKNWLTSLRIREKKGDKIPLAQSYNTVGSIYREQGKYSKALVNHLAALQIFKEPGMPPWGIAMSYEDIGKAYESQGDSFYLKGGREIAAKKFLLALKNYTASLQYIKKIANREGLAEICNDIGYIHIKLKTFGEAKNYFEKSLHISSDIRNKRDMRMAYQGLSTLDSIRGNFKRAYEDYKMYMLYRDSLNNEESAKKSLQSKMQYEFDKKESLAKAKQDKKDTLSKAEVENQKIIHNISYIGTLAVLGFAAIGFYRFRKRKILQNQQSLMNERLRISRELHDEVGATLSGIAMYSHLTREQIKNANIIEVEKSLSIMQKSAGEMVNKLNDIVWFINPGQDSLQKLMQRLEEYATDMAMVKNIRVKVNLPAALEEQRLPVESRRNIYLFCKEAINNAVKYSNCTLLQFTVKYTDSKLEFSVCDNGKGFDVVMVRRGNGLENMQTHAKEIGAKLTVLSKQDEGSLLSMQIKIT